jgi:hypothetical protein
MTITVKGKLRRRHRVAIGPIRVDRWCDHNFTWEYSAERQICEEFVEVAPSLELAVEHVGSRHFVRAKLKGRAYLLCDAETAETRIVSFSVLSIAGMELGGRVSFQPPLPHRAPGSRDVEAA